MPLTEQQISTFYSSPTLHEDLLYLVDAGYLSFDYPKDLVNGVRVKDITKEKAYNLVSGKLSFPFTTILSPHQHTPTMVATDMSRIGVVDGNRVRALTRREGLRLFGFPETYSISDDINDKEAYDLMGNSICVPVVQARCEKMIASNM